MGEAVPLVSARPRVSNHQKWSEKTCLLHSLALEFFIWNNMSNDIIPNLMFVILLMLLLERVLWSIHYVVWFSLQWGVAYKLLYPFYRCKIWRWGFLAKFTQSVTVSVLPLLIVFKIKARENRITCTVYVPDVFLGASICYVVVWSLSCVRLFCDPMDRSPPGSSVHGLSQARILKCVASSSYRGSSRLRD